jgi:hypothetical protein
MSKTLIPASSLCCQDSGLADRLSDSEPDSKHDNAESEQARGVKRADGGTEPAEVIQHRAEDDLTCDDADDGSRDADARDSVADG